MEKSRDIRKNCEMENIITRQNVRSAVDFDRGFCYWSRIDFRFPLLNGILEFKQENIIFGVVCVYRTDFSQKQF